MIDPHKIGGRLCELRHGKGISQNEFAEIIGISPTAVSMYENGERIPRDGIKMKIANFYNKGVQEIFFT